MSVLGKKWVLINQNQKADTMEKLLENRKSRGLLITESFNDPYLFKDMKKAIERVNKAIDNNERIIVFGDYDVDGISGAAILIKALQRKNANVSYRLPNRENDGYGLSNKFIDEFIEKEVGLIITVDCGICCNEQVEKAHENGIDTIITDHHIIPLRVPVKAVAIIHPKLDDKYPDTELTGAGVALKFSQALIEDDEEFINSLIELALLGTIADMGPLTGENRLIVKKGLSSLPNTKNIGLKKLMQLASIDTNTKFETETIGFQIAPRLNAAGRIGNPYKALQLLIGESEENVDALGNELETLNQTRRDMTASSIDEVEEMINTYKDEVPSIIVKDSEKWHVGILGLIAGKVAEKYSKPSIMLTNLGDTYVASARSVNGFDMVEALGECKEYLDSFGGHYMAAGFNIKKKNLKNFKEAIREYADKKLGTEKIISILEIDCEINKNEIDKILTEKIDELSPFGIANNKPIFLIKGVKPKQVNQVGATKAHLRFQMEINGQSIGAIGFRLGTFASEIQEGATIDLVATIEVNHWKNKEYIQLNTLDFKVNIFQ